MPKELCVCETIAKEEQRITVTVEKRKFGKKITVVSGLNPKEIDVKDVCKKLKEKFACGGTVKENGIVELQGVHLANIKEALAKIGFAPETIEVS